MKPREKAVYWTWKLPSEELNQGHLLQVWDTREAAADMAMKYAPGGYRYETIKISLTVMK